MRRRSAVFHISISLAGVTAGILLLAQSLHLLPDSQATIRTQRASLSEAIATQCALAMRDQDFAASRAFIRAMQQRTPDLLWAEVADAHGNIVLEMGHHAQAPNEADPEHSTLTRIRVTLMRDQKRSGMLELCFAPPPDGYLAVLSSEPARLIAFVTLLSFLTSLIILRRSLRHLDPSAVIPDRVHQMLNTLTEAVLVLDADERIVLANASFLTLVEEPLDELLGRNASQLPCWIGQSDDLALNKPRLPWVATIKSRQSQIAVPIRMYDGSGCERSMIINAAPIANTTGGVRGVLVTLDDLTPVEQKNAELEKALQMLEASRKKIEQQNLELQTLATIDPLTGCTNRRSLYSSLETQWASCKRYGHALSCVLLDIDHFKMVNDEHGHGVGDQVLQTVAKRLRDAARASDIVCRYGGEEFLILMPQTDLESGVAGAERLRRKVCEAPICGLAIAASFGVSAVELGAANPQALIEQADKALYRSKCTGRNRVTAWDAACEGPLTASKQCTPPITSPPPREPAAIAVRAVSALMDLMNHRDSATAQHSMRVADLSVLLANEVLKSNTNHLVEVAALLHDIGKLGVPDAVLLKPGPLTDEERLVMDAHDRLGVQIILSALGSSEVARYVECHHAHFSGNSNRPHLPVGEDIPLPSRIIAIADAFDAMTSDRPYRKATSKAHAFNELHRCAGKQFDPQLIERFIAIATRASDSHGETVVAA